MRDYNGHWSLYSQSVEDVIDENLAHVYATSSFPLIDYERDKHQDRAGNTHPRARSFKSAPRGIYFVSYSAGTPAVIEKRRETTGYEQYFRTEHL